MFSVVDIIILSQTYRYCNVASFAIIIYDWAICLQLEAELIWPTRWSLGKVLYIAARYSPLSDSILLLYLASPNHSTPTCDRVFSASAWLTIIGMVISESNFNQLRNSPEWLTLSPLQAVLVFRTWAVWERNPKLFPILLGVLCLGVITGFVLARISLARVEFGTTAEGYPSGCWLVAFLNPVIIFDYIIILCFEIIILILTLYKCRDAIKRQRSKLLITLHRDAILYCFFIAVCSLANIINQVIPAVNAPSFEELQRVIHSVLTARILLNLRQAVTATSQDNTLNWEVANRRRPLRRYSETRTRNGQRKSEVGSVIGRYLSTIFIASLDLDPETWTHDEESAKRSETTADEESIGLNVLSIGSPDQEAQ